MASRDLAELLRCLVRGKVERLLGVLAELDAVYRNDDRRIRPTASHLMGRGHQLLVTRLGPLDALGAIESETYADLIEHSSYLELGDGLAIRVLELSKLIELKRQAGRPKDMAILPVLEATLEVTQKVK